MSDSVLIAKILHRDRQALASFYRTWAPKLTTYITKKIDDPRDVEEVLQDTLFAFLEAVRDFQGTAKLSTFLYGICHHKIADYHRKKRVKLMIFSHWPQLELLVSPLLSPEETLDTHLLRAKIYTALTKLLPLHRQILLKKYIDKQTMSEIAREFHLSIKSVEARLFRARKAFVAAFISI